ncbi:MAG: hypothetical protein LUG99_03780 [Lachnospiraceae bacterium]|nr:hypothetical protein [Lachnospiraceae bacterium]
MSDRLDFIVKTKEDLINAVHRVGFLPLFRNFLPGFSVEDHVDPSVWFTGEPGVWEWKGPVIQEAGCAYGKFFGDAFTSAVYQCEPAESYQRMWDYFHEILPDVPDKALRKFLR